MTCFIWDTGSSGFPIGGDLPGALLKLSLVLFIIGGMICLVKVLLSGILTVIGEGGRA